MKQYRAERKKLDPNYKEEEEQDVIEEEEIVNEDEILDGVKDDKKES